MPAKTCSRPWHTTLDLESSSLLPFTSLEDVVTVPPRSSRCYTAEHPLALTNDWRLWDAITGHHRPPTLIELHQKNGDIVRIGPNVLSFSHPQAIRDIYGADKPYRKSMMYWTAAAANKGVPSPSLFSSVDMKWHDDLRYAVQPAFNLSALREYEPFVDDTVSSLLRQLSERFADKDGEAGVVYLTIWMQWYAFDVIGELTYGAPVGFMDTASDVGGIIASAHWYLVYAMYVMQMPWLDLLLLKNPVLLWMQRQGWLTAKSNPIVEGTLQRQQARAKAGKPGGDRVDLIVKFLLAKDKHPETVNDRMILGLGISMVLAGSESTAISLTAILYYVLRNPPVCERLRTEIDQALPDLAPGTPAPFNISLKLPYLDACVKEGFRMHPAGRVTPERVIPAPGATIAGHDVPGGTIVGVNAWPLHRRKDVFGGDPEVFKPERWLPVSDADRPRIAEMNRLLSHFGHGKFVCIGKNISHLEMYKVIPSLLRTFDLALEEPGKDFRFESGSFANVSGVDVRMRTREQ